jgi:four helix bundle protein
MRDGGWSELSAAAHFYANAEVMRTPAKASACHRSRRARGQGGETMKQPMSHKDLPVWQKAISLASKLYNATNGPPHAEGNELTRQIRRAAISVPSNIAEGASHGRRAQFIHHLALARGALTGLETQVRIAANANLLSDAEQLESEIAEIGRMLTSLIRKLQEQRSLERVVR